MAELVYAFDLKSNGEIRAGSIPAPSTIFVWYDYIDMEKVYIAIDLKSFYASVECVERGLDPLKAKLVVADESRTDKTICLAVSPALKALGIPGRARLYEVKQKARDFIIAPPRMAFYISYSTRIYNIYLRYISLNF